ncbi:MAG: CvpA family protein [Pseudomonadota bacterium]
MDLTSTDFAWVIDALVGVLVIVSAYLAMVRGAIRELFALLSWAAAFFAAFAFAPMLQPMLTGLPGIGGYLRDCNLSMVVAFVIVFGVALIATGILIWVFSGTIRNTALSLFDQGVGFIYGALRGLVLVAVIYIAYQQIVLEADRYQFIENAYTIGVVQATAEIIQSIVPDEVPAWLEGRVNALMDQCGAASDLEDG